MTKFAFLALLFCIYYIAGMYESPALMVLFLTQLLLLPVMFLLSVYLKRHLTVSFAEKTVYAEQGLPFTWRLQAVNSGRLPVSRFLTKIRISRIGRRVQERKKVQRSSECGIQTSKFRDVPEHCGIERFRAERVKVYDYLSLFSRTKEMEDEMKVIVFPRKYDMRIETESPAEGGANPYRHDPFLPGRDHDEVRQIREYRDSDSIRHIHWNQTARSGQLWVKEYEEEKTGCVSLFLDLKEEKASEASDADAFYTLLWALVFGLLKRLSSVRVCWKAEGSGRICGMEVRDEQQCRRMFALLYQDGAAQTADGSLQEYRIRHGDMRLTRDLKWSAGETLIYQFSKDTLEEELRDKVFRIGPVICETLY